MQLSLSKSLFLSAAALLAGTTLLAAPASAQTVFTDLASFNAAAGSTSVETFTTAAPFNTTGAFTQAYNGFTLSGNGLGNNIGVHTGAVSGGPNNAIPAPFAGQQFFSWGDGGPGNVIGPLTFTFTQPTNSFAFDWFNTDPTDQYRITFSDGSTFTSPPFTLAGNTASSGFFGVVFAAPVTSATISNVTFGGFISDEGFDNVRVRANATVVPEPSTYAAGGILGATLLFGMVRTKRRPHGKNTPSAA